LSGGSSQKNIPNAPRVHGRIKDITPNREHCNMVENGIFCSIVVFARAVWFASPLAIKI